MSEENVNGEVRIDIHDNKEETQNDVNPSREHVIDIPKTFKKFIEMMKSLSINVPLVEALEQIPGYAKFMKDLVTKKRYMDCETIKMTHKVLSIMHSMAPKLEDPDAFTIPCIVQSRANSMRLQMVDRTMKRPLGIIDDFLVQVDKFILPADFVILDFEVDYELPIIVGRPFLPTGKALVDMEAGELTFRVGDEKVVFHVCKSMKQPNSTDVCSFVDLVTEVIVDDTSAMINVEDPLEAVLLNHDATEDEVLVDATLEVLQQRKKEIGWTLADIRGLRPASCMHKIILEDDVKPPVEHQMRLNEAMQEVFKEEVIKWLDAEVVYPILDSSWTSMDAKFVFNDDCMKPFDLIKYKLTTTRIITSSNWSLPFELICDASDIVVGVILGQRVNKMFHLVYYTRKTMNDAHVNYMVTDKELLEIVFAMEKIRPYHMGAKVIVHTDHATLRYLMTKKDSKARLMRWVLLLQEFDLEIVD
ncbi:uncharacterized protein [Nicotiana sylvestris]|uniref:uncharacterized protein n=1 Tax=Nicotiana sylvestris TaxID=4096 RepID=UPI00388C4C62